MATDLGQATKPAPAPKYETFVAQQLARTRGRIRKLDFAAGLFFVLIATFGYALGMSLLDRALELSPYVRLAAFLVFAVVTAFFAGRFLLRILVRPVNPLYAARQLEQTLPAAKNSVVNWLDLHD